MRFTSSYSSPVGRLLLASDGESLTGLWLEGQKYYAAGLCPNAVERSALPVFLQTKVWLDRYFGGEHAEPKELPLSPAGTPFCTEIWRFLLQIPYGEVLTYGQLAKLYEQATGKSTSARAVGGAVGRNPISIIIPCHRVVGAGGSLTGYAGGIAKKQLLLELEQKHRRG